MVLYMPELCYLHDNPAPIRRAGPTSTFMSLLGVGGFEDDAAGAPITPNCRFWFVAVVAHIDHRSRDVFHSTRSFQTHLATTSNLALLGSIPRAEDIWARLTPRVTAPCALNASLIICIDHHGRPGPR